MSEDGYLSAAFMIVDSYFVDEGVTIAVESEPDYPDVYPDDSMILSLGDYVLQHTSAQDYHTRDVI